MPLRRVLVLPVLLLATALASVTFAASAEAATFSDTEGTSYEEAVEALVEADIIHGCREGRFCPAARMTRAQLAAVLVRALDVPAAEREHFDDLGETIHRDDINALAEAGITQGCTEGAFCPSAAVSRGEVASLLDRAFDTEEEAEAYFDDTWAPHADAIDRLAAAGIAAGCGRPLTAFCQNQPLLRGQAALFVARAHDLVDRVEVSSLEARRAEQAEIDAERERQREAERQRAQEEERARQEAEREKKWDDLAQCESGGNWSINTGNGYYGGLQFSLSSWQSVGGSGYPHQHSREEQIRRAEILLERQGWGAWPACSRKLGYR